MAIDPQFALSIRTLLGQSLLPDTGTVKAAEEGLKAQATNPQLVPALFQILTESPEDGLRLSASLGLQKRVAHVWPTLRPEVHEGMKSKLLLMATQDSQISPSVRSSVAQVVGTVASIELLDGLWPSLIPTVVHLIEQGTPEQRLSSLTVLYILLEELPVEPAWGVSGSQLVTLLSSTLSDPSNLDVRVLSVRSLGKLDEALDEEDGDVSQQIQSLFPIMAQILQQAFEADDTSSVKHLLEVFDTFFLSPAPHLTAFLSDLLDFYLSTAARQDVDEDLREAFINSTTWIISYKSARIQQLDLAPRLVLQAMTIVTTGELEEDESNPAMVALSLLATLARDMAPSQVWPTAQTQLQKFMGSLDPMFRSAGLLTLGSVADGLSSTLRDEMELVWAVLETGIQDSEPYVQKAALVCLADLCEQVGDELVQHHEVIMPALMTLIAQEVTQTQAARALDLYLENLGDDISLYLRPVMETLAGYLDSAPIPIRKSLIAAIGSAAYAAGPEFESYLPVVMTKLTPYLMSFDPKNEELMDFRAVTQDTVGQLAEAVDKETFRPYFEQTMELAYGAFSMDHPMLRESSFLYFGSMAKVYQEEFAPFLPKIAPKIIEALTQREREPVDDSEQEDDEDDWDTMINPASSPIVAEKQAATEAVGGIFEHTQKGYLPYLQRSVETLVTLSTHTFPDLRKSAIEALFSCAQTLNKISGTKTWSAGAHVAESVSPEMEQLIDAVMANVLNVWEDETNELVSNSICQSLAETLLIVGPALIAKYLDNVGKMALSVLEKTSLAQCVEANDEDEQDEDSAEHEILYVQSGMDLVVALADTLGTDFTSLFQTILPHLIKYAEPTRSNTERKSALDTLGHVMGGIKSCITPFTADLFPVLDRGLGDIDAPTRTAAIYAVGVLVQFSARDLGPYYPHVLKALQPSLALEEVEEQPSDLRAQRDNALGCLARMVRKHPHALPLDQTLSLLFASLPILEDSAEWAPIIQLFLSLIAANEPVQQYIEEILRVFAQALVLGSSESDESEQQEEVDFGSPLDIELRSELLECIRSLYAQIPAQIQAAGLEQYLA